MAFVYEVSEFCSGRFDIGANLFLKSSNMSINRAKGASREVNIGPRGYPPSVPNNRSEKNAPQRESIKQLAPTYRNAALVFDIWSKIALQLIQKVQEIGPRVPQVKLKTVQGPPFRGLEKINNCQQQRRHSGKEPRNWLPFLVGGFLLDIFPPHHVWDGLRSQF